MPINNQSTNVGNYGRFAPSVQYSPAVKAPTMGDITIKTPADTESLNIDLRPVAEALLKANEYDYKLKESEMEGDLKRLELQAKLSENAQKEANKGVLRNAYNEISQLEAAASSMTPTEYLAQRRNIQNKFVALYKGDPKDVVNMMNSAGEGNFEEVVALRKDAAMDVQDREQERFKTIISGSKYLSNLPHDIAIMKVKENDNFLNTYFSFKEVADNVELPEELRAMAKNNAEMSGREIMINLYKAILSDTSLNLQNPAEYRRIVEENAKQLSVLCGMSFSEALVLSERGAAEIGLTDLSDWHQKSYKENIGFVEDTNKLLEQSERLKLNQIPVLRYAMALSPEFNRNLLETSPSYRQLIQGALEQVSSLDTTQYDNYQLKVLGLTENWNVKGVGNVDPAVAVGRMHAAAHLNPTNVALDIVDYGNRNGFKSPFADHQWQVARGGVMATLANQAMSVNTSSDAQQVINNVKQVDPVVNGPAAKGKVETIKTQNTNNPVAMNIANATDKNAEVFEGMAETYMSMDNDTFEQLTQSRNYLNNTISRNRLRIDTKNGRVELAKDTKGFKEFMGQLNELHLYMNVEEINKKIAHMPLKSRNKALSWMFTTRTEGLIQALEDGEEVVTADNVGKISTAVTGILDFAGMGVDSIVEGGKKVKNIAVNEAKEFKQNRIEELQKRLDGLTIKQNLSSHIHPETENLQPGEAIVTIDDQDNGITYDYEKTSGKQFLSVDGVIYNGTTDLYKTPIKKVEKEDSEGGVELKPDLGWYSDKDAVIMEEGIIKLQKRLDEVDGGLMVPPTGSMTDFKNFPLVKNVDGTVSNVKTEVKEYDGIYYIMPTMGNTKLHFGGYRTLKAALTADKEMHKELNKHVR